MVAYFCVERYDVCCVCIEAPPKQSVCPCLSVCDISKSHYTDWQSETKLLQKTLPSQFNRVLWTGRVCCLFISTVIVQLMLISSFSIAEMCLLSSRIKTKSTFATFSQRWGSLLSHVVFSLMIITALCLLGAVEMWYRCCLSGHSDEIQANYQPIVHFPPLFLSSVVSIVVFPPTAGGGPVWPYLDWTVVDCSSLMFP